MAHEGGNPRSQPFKQLEMSIKRAYQLNSGLIDTLAKAGSIYDMKEGRRWWIMDSKDLKSALNWGNYGKEDSAILYHEVWCWTIDHWYSGALRRSVVAMMDNLTEDNKNAIKTKVDELYE